MLWYSHAESTLVCGSRIFRNITTSHVVIARIKAQQYLVVSEEAALRQSRDVDAKVWVDYTTPILVVEEQTSKLLSHLSDGVSTNEDLAVEVAQDLPYKHVVCKVL